MRNIYNNPILQKYGCKLIMSVHDENLVIAPKEPICHQESSLQFWKGKPLNTNFGAKTTSHIWKEIKTQQEVTPAN